MNRLSNSFPPSLVLGLTLVWFCLGLGSAKAQMVPQGFGFEKGVQAITLVRDNCAVCDRMVREFPANTVTFVDTTAKQQGEPYRRDSNDLVARTLRIKTFPTTVVLLNGQIVERYAGYVSAAEVQSALSDTRNQTRFAQTRYKIVLNETTVPGFERFSGVLSFWRGGCENCQLEKPSLARMCQKRPLGVAVLWTRDEGKIDGCTHASGRALAMRLGITLVPTTLFVVKGKIV